MASSLQQDVDSDVYWDNFQAQQHLVDLRDRLLESNDTSVQQKATKVLQKKCTMELKFQFSNEERLTCYALDPTGEYLAVGTHLGANDTGRCQIFETATGRAIHRSEPIEWGVGNFGDPINSMQWHDGRLYAVTQQDAVSQFDEKLQLQFTAWVTNGWGSAPAYAVKGNRVAVSVGGTTPFAIVSMEGDKSELFEGDAISPEINNLEEIETGDRVYAFVVCHWQDNVIYGEGHHVYAMDMDSNRLLYYLKNPLSQSAWSPDCRQMAGVDTEGCVSFMDGATGAIHSTHISASHTSQCVWSHQSQLAVVSDTSVLIFRNSKLQHTIDVQSGAPTSNYTFEDTKLWSWSPDKTNHGAVLLRDGSIRIYLIEEDKVTRINTVSVPLSCSGIVFAARNVIVGIGQFMLEFRHAESGSLIARVDRQKHSDLVGVLYPEGNSALRVGNLDFTEDYEDHLFPFGNPPDAVWVAVFKNGLVVCENLSAQAIDNEVHWVVDGSFSWPWKWGGGNLATLSSLVDSDAWPLSKRDRQDVRRELQKKKARPDAELRLQELCPNDESKTLYDVANVLIDSFDEMDGWAWGSHMDDAKLELAGFYALLDKFDEARQLCITIGFVGKRIQTLCNVAIIAFRKQQSAVAKKLVDKAIQLHDNTKADLSRHTDVMAALSVALDLVKGSGGECFHQLALGSLEHEVNEGQGYCQLATYYIEGGKSPEALELVGQLPKDNSFRNDFVRHIQELGFVMEGVAMQEEPLSRCSEKWKAVANGLLCRRLYKDALNTISFDAGLEMAVYQTMLDDGQQELADRLSAHQCYRLEIAVFRAKHGFAVVHNHWWSSLLTKLRDIVAASTPQEKQALLLSMQEEVNRREDPSLKNEDGESDSDSSEDGIFSGMELENKKTFESRLLLGHAALAANNEELARRSLYAAFPTTSRSRSDLRQAITKRCLHSDLPGAYRVWRQHAVTDRKYEAMVLVESLARAKHLAGVLQVIRQLPSGRPEERMEHSLAALRVAMQNRILENNRQILHSCGTVPQEYSDPRCDDEEIILSGLGEADAELDRSLFF